MYTTLPKTSETFANLNWSDIEPWYHELEQVSLSEETLQSWLQQWSDLSTLVDETLTWLDISCTRDTSDQERPLRQERFLNNVYTHIQTVDQRIKEKLLESGLQPEGFELPLRKLRSETENFRAENVALLNEEKKLSSEYLQLGGEQTVEWEGKEVNINSLYPVLADPDRERRERVWRTVHERLLADRPVRNEQWVKLFQLRQEIARNAGYDNYRDYRWQQMFRFDYTPADSKAFDELIEQEIVPVASTLWEKRRQMLGVETLRPWDTQVNPHSDTAPRPVTDVPGLMQQIAGTFHHIDPNLGSYFDTMIKEDLLDLEERPNKAPGGYNLPLEVRKLPFIFGRVNTIEDIVGLVFHEAGHAFHVFEMQHLSYLHQRKEAMLPMEFAEVASTSMEFIGSMHLAKTGLCTEREATLLRIQHLEEILISYLPMIVLGDAFQQWIYENPELALDPNQCDLKWAELNRRYSPAINWTGLEAALRVGWQRVLHYFCTPFYMIEYGFAAIGALQIWNNYLSDPQAALHQYRSALALGTTRSLPELYAAAGANFSFTPETIRPLVQLIMQTVEDLQSRL